MLLCNTVCMYVCMRCWSTQIVGSIRACFHPSSSLKQLGHEYWWQILLYILHQGALKPLYICIGLAYLLGSVWPSGFNAQSSQERRLLHGMLSYIVMQHAHQDLHDVTLECDDDTYEFTSTDRQPKTNFWMFDVYCQIFLGYELQHSNTH